MTNDHVRKLAQSVGRSLCRCASDQCSIVDNDPGLCRTLILLLAKGQPVSAEAVARVAERPLEEVLAAIQASGNVELDEQGNVVGAGLSLRPTPHRLTFNGRILYTWCALDALMYPPLIGETVVVESPCAATRVFVRVLITTKGVAAVHPAGAVVSIVQPENCTNVREGFCNDVHFFRSQEAAGAWLARHPQAVLLSVAEAFVLGQQLTLAQNHACSCCTDLDHGTD